MTTSPHIIDSAPFDRPPTTSPKKVQAMGSSPFTRIPEKCHRTSGFRFSTAPA
jgi:hypothetical protein